MCRSACQALRGSSEFHAWGDSNLYLRRHGEQLTLSVEHRAAASISNMHLVLDTADAAVALRTIEPGGTGAEPALPATGPDLSLEQRLIEHLAAATMPITATALRKLCQVRNTALHRALSTLVDAGRVRKNPAGYALVR